MAVELNGNTIPEKQSSNKIPLKGNCKGEFPKQQRPQLNIMAQCTTCNASATLWIVTYRIYLCLFFRLQSF